MVERYDVVCAGTGFATSFFLLGYLEKAPASARVLVLEKGEQRPHGWQLQHPSRLKQESLAHVDVAAVEAGQGAPAARKDWWFTVAQGGGSNCWWGCTPRLLPSDFRMHSTYGVGRDWPVSYDALEAHYTRVEQVMSVSGDSARSPFPMSRPYPLPPHGLSEPDRRLQAAHPESFFVQPCARPTRAVHGRASCCGNQVCHLCPIDAKFTILNSMADVYADPRVELRTGAAVQALELKGGQADGVVYLAEGREARAGAELVCLGANAIFNAHILLRSGLKHPLLGRRLFEQAGVPVRVLLDGLDGFQGTTSITGHEYMLYDGAHRAERGATLIQTENVPNLRDVRGKWRQALNVHCVIEDLPLEDNHVRVGATDATRPQLVFGARSDYARRTFAQLEKLLERALSPLPIERIIVPKDFQPTESHVLGTTVMGDDPEHSVVDRHLVHHAVRNLLVLGGGAFPTAAPANPTLTISALSLWAAAHLVS